VVQGAVLSATKSEVRVDIGGVMVGVVRGRELDDSEYDELNVGDTVEATVLEEENENGEVELSFRAAGFARAWLRVTEAMQSSESVEVKVVDANKGGLMVVLGPIAGFLPVSQLSPDNYPRVPGGDKQKILDHLRSFVGKPMKVKVLDALPRDEKLIVSEKLVWEEDQKDILDQYTVGNIIEGKVSALTSFGAFISFGDGLEGLVHISEIAWQRIDHPKDVLSLEQEVKAQVIQIDGSKIFLSMKRLVDDPWKSVKERYALGQKVRGRVLKVNPFGLFVELDPEIHGLAHISELSNEAAVDINAFAKPGQEMDFEVVSIEPAAHRLGLRVAGVAPKVQQVASSNEQVATEGKNDQETKIEDSEITSTLPEETPEKIIDENTNRSDE
jgi:ribosomal protein S1